jgi:outer membrane lipoprotein SlyB
MSTAGKIEPSAFRKWLVAPTTTAGAITGGTIGAFTGNLIGTAAGMLLGALAASAIEHTAGESSKARTHGKTPAR